MINIIIFIGLIFIVLLIYFVCDKTLAIARSYETLDELIAKIFKILKERQEYIKENYQILEVEEFYNYIKNQSDLKKRLELEFKYDFDDKSSEFLIETKDAITNYNDAVNKHQSLINKHPLLTKIFKYNNYKRL